MREDREEAGGSQTQGQEREVGDGRPCAELFRAEGFQSYLSFLRVIAPPK